MPYQSQLEKMRQRVLHEGGGNIAFYHELVSNLQNPNRSRQPHDADVDRRQYEAEYELFKRYWPTEPFYGQPPHMKYIKMARRIYEKCIVEGVSLDYHDREWESVCRLTWDSVLQNHGIDYCHFYHERELWKILFEEQAGAFSGVDPSAMENGEVRGDIQENDQLEDVDVNGHEDNTVTFTSSAVLNIEATSKSDNFLKNIITNQNNIKALSKALKCQIKIIEETSADSQLLRVAFLPTDEELSMTELGETLSARFVGRWGEMDVLEGWEEIVHALQEVRSDAKRRRVH